VPHCLEYERRKGAQSPVVVPCGGVPGQESLRGPNGKQRRVTETEQHRLAHLAEVHVGGGGRGVRNAYALQVCKGIRYRSEDGDRLPCLETRARSHQRGEAATSHPLEHGDRRPVLAGRDIEQSHAVGMDCPRQCIEFPADVAQRRLPVKHLERHGLGDEHRRVGG
jgi:hypothetical protein